MIKIKLTDIEWEPQDEFISEREWKRLLKRAPKTAVLEVEDEYEDLAQYMDTDELRFVGCATEIIG